MGVQLYAHGPEYWKYVESLAIRYAEEWGRSAIFTQEKSQP